MKINIHSKNIDLSQEHKDYITEKMEKLAHYGGRVDDESSEIRVEIDKETNRNIEKNIVIQVTLFVPHSTIRAEDHADSVEAAVDEVEEKLKKQIERYKAKMHRRDSEGQWIPQSTIEEATEEEEFQPPKILRRKRIEKLKPMYEDEAIENMELIGHTFFLFQNKNTDRVSLLYKREDGFYGIIEPHTDADFK